MQPFFAISILLFGSLAINAQESQSRKALAQPKVVEAIAPVYPEAATSLSAEGRVQVAVSVNPSGRVTSVKLLWGPQILAQAAIDAARRWKFVESKDRQTRVAELAFIFLITDKPGESRASFVPPNQIEVVTRGSGRNLTVTGPTVGEDDEHPGVVRFVAPVFPAIARAVRASGEVRVSASINEKGQVVVTAVEGGHPLLQASAVKAAKQWEFTLSVKKERVITLTFFFNGAPNRGGKTTFVDPYRVEIIADEPHIDITRTP